MLTARETIHDFLGGDPVETDDLKAAVGILLTAWEDLMTLGVRVSMLPHTDADRHIETDTLLWRLCWLDGDLDDDDVDTKSVTALADFIATKKVS